MLKHSGTIVALVAFVFAGAAPALEAQSTGGAGVPVPKVTGPIPVTADSYPLMAAGTLQDPVDLPRLGYVEEEFFVSGTANVYDWAPDGALTVKTPNAPYTTRILVRRPADPGPLQRQRDRRDGKQRAALRLGVHVVALVRTFHRERATPGCCSPTCRPPLTR